MLNRTTFVVLSLLLAATKLSAQTTTPDLKTTASEVVVTGSRFATPVEDATSQVIIIDSVEIARQPDLGRLLNQRAGLHINGIHSSAGKDRSVFLRNSANQYTLLLVDGQPLIDPSSLGGPVDLRLLDLTNVSRIEIVRGARSLLYGSDAVAGVINLITHDGSGPEGFSGDLHLEAGSYKTLEAGTTLRYNSEKVTVTIGGSTVSSNGLSEAIPHPDSVGVGDYEDDSFSRLSTTASVAYRPNKQWSIQPAIRLAQFDNDFDGGSFQDADNNAESELLNPSLAVDYRGETWRAGGRYILNKTNRSFTNQYGTTEYHGLSQQGDVFTGTTFGQMSVNGGVQLRAEAITDRGDMVDDLNSTTVSPYFQLGYGFGAGTILEFGLRYNHHSEFGGQPNYSLAALQNLSDQWQLRASVASAFLSPSLDQLAGPFGANPDLEPQQSVSVELGTRYAANQGKYNFDLSFFYRDIEDLITYTSRYVNEGNVHNFGIETQGSAMLTEDWTLQGNITYVQGEKEEISSTGETIETDEFYRRPRTTAYLSLEYAPTNMPLAIRLGGHYVSSRPDVWFDSSFGRHEIELDAYFLANLYAEYKLLPTRNLTLFGELRNLTDTDFVEVTGFVTRGINFRMGARLTLGK